MRWRLLLSLLVISLLMFPSVALAEGAGSSDDLMLRVNGPITVNANEEVGTVVVISDNAVISGIVRQDLVVISGDATVTGTIEGNVTIYRGTLDLRGTSRVAGDVNLVNSTLTRASGATVEGSLSHSSFNWSGWEFFALSVYLWISATIAIVVAGLIFAAVGGRQLMGAGNLIGRKLGATILSAVIAGIGVPLLAVVAFATVLGIPLGIGLLLFLIPALWFFGYLVAGTKLGAVILRQEASDHPYLASVLGLVLLQAIGLIPFLGGLVSFFAGILGVGALVLLGWNAWRGPEKGEPVEARRAEPAM
ncbi:MAG: polymer-forming cytoskeletal protein [Nitrolancea sp.]